jgi:hypothetical protein
MHTRICHNSRGIDMKRRALTLLFAVILPVGITWAADFAAGSMGLRQGQPN